MPEIRVGLRPRMRLQILYAPLRQLFQLVGGSLQIKVTVVVVERGCSLRPCPIHAALTVKNGNGRLRRGEQRQREQSCTGRLTGTGDATDHDSRRLGIGQFGEIASLGHTVSDCPTIPIGQIGSLNGLRFVKRILRQNFVEVQHPMAGAKVIDFVGFRTIVMRPSRACLSTKSSVTPLIWQVKSNMASPSS